jgi:hypothetical protein
MEEIKAVKLPGEVWQKTKKSALGFLILFFRVCMLMGV